MISFRGIQEKDEESVVTLWKRCALTRDWNDPYKDIKFAREGETSTVLVGIVDEHIVASVMVAMMGTGVFSIISRLIQIFKNVDMEKQPSPPRRRGCGIAACGK